MYYAVCCSLDNQPVSIARAGSIPPAFGIMSWCILVSSSSKLKTRGGRWERRHAVAQPEEWVSVETELIMWKIITIKQTTVSFSPLPGKCLQIHVGHTALGWHGTRQNFMHEVVHSDNLLKVDWELYPMGIRLIAMSWVRQIPSWVKVTKVQHVSFLLYPSLPLHFPCERAMLMQWPPYRAHAARTSCLSI